MIGERAIADLEFEKVLDIVRQGCLSDEGRAYISPALFSTDPAVIASRAGRIESIITRIGRGEVVLDPFVSLLHSSRRRMPMSSITTGGCSTT